MMNGAEGAPEKELRLALAMRGGVSLAVWMGGACSEIDQLRRACPGDSTPYGELLEAAGYSSAVVDVIAGTSAGGLNGALMASSVVDGRLFDKQVRNLWLKIGDLGKLLRPVFGRWPKSLLVVGKSLLDGDGYFYDQLYKEMKKLQKEPLPEPLCGQKPRLDLVLTGTLLEPKEVTDYPELGAPINSTRHRATFRFRHYQQRRPETLPLEYQLSDFTPSGEGSIQCLRQLAYAARSTSSFPGAFEPARIRFARSTEPDPEPPEPPSTFYGIYSESRDSTKSRDSTNGDADLVVDGGVLDNIPISWAVRSIAAAPASGAVDRWLVYLQPLPPAPLEESEAESEAERRRTSWSTVPTLLRVRKVKADVESITEDFDTLRHYQQQARRREAFPQILDQILGQGISDQDGTALLRSVARRALLAAEDYQTRLGKLEAERISALWCNPLPILGVDPLGYQGINTNPLRKRPERSENGATSASDLLKTLTRPAASAELALGPVPQPAASQPDDLDALVTLGGAIRTPQALARTVSVLLDECRRLKAPEPRLKADLYDLRFDIECFIALHDRALVKEVADRTTGDAVELVRLALCKLTRQSQSTGWPADPFRKYWDSLVTHAHELAQAVPDSESSLFRCLKAARQDPDKAANATRALLIAIELLTGTQRPDPLAETGDINFHMVSAGNTTPIMELMLDAEKGIPLPIDDKLAGNQLYNFGSFLSARWRHNDWIWGRLDAARSLVDITAHRLDGTRSKKWKDDLCEQLHQRILCEELPLLGKLKDEPSAFPESIQPAPLYNDVKDKIKDLRAIGKEEVRTMARKRFRVILRLLAVAPRALLPPMIPLVKRKLRDMVCNINRSRPFSEKSSPTIKRGSDIKDYSDARMS